MPLSRFDRLLAALDLEAAGGDPGTGAGALAPTLLESALDLHPHQVEAALFALSRPAGRGAILADEVGLGKTVEAGLVVCQRLAEGAARVLVLVPASLRAQWQAELRRFFAIEARIADLAALKRERARFAARGVHVASHTFFASESCPSWFRDADWDLVVIDEAHRLRNVWRPEAVRARRIRDALRGKPKLLLTATPFQNSLLELFGLVSFADERLLGTEASFRHHFLKDERGLEPESPDELKRRLAGVLTRTLRRQVAGSIRFPSRRSLLYDFEPGPAEREVYDRVSAYLGRARAVALAFGNRELLLLVYRKILASSTFAVAATLRKLSLTLAARLAGQVASPDPGQELDGIDEETEELDEARPEAPRFTREEVEGELAELRAMAALAESVRANAKGERLVAALREVFASARERGWPEKAVVFTESRRTLEYLERLLAERGFAGCVVPFHGGSGDAMERDRAIGEFRDRARVLLATEAGAEGLNLQFCNVVVNYDLPWNPQRIEQRIGRCHRYGQPLDVVVVNFLNTANAADRRLYDLLARKLELFDGVFGSSDDVLGALESGVDFERRVLSIYQSCRTPEEIDRAFDALAGEVEARKGGALDDQRRRLLDGFDAAVRERLEARSRAIEEDLARVEREVRELVLAAAVRAEPEPGCSRDGAPAGARVLRVEWPAEVVLSVPADRLPERVAFRPGANAPVLGPRSPAIRALAAHVAETEGPPTVHELVVRAASPVLRGRRGYWFRWRMALEETAPGGGARGHVLADAAVLEGDAIVLDDETLEALRASPREHAGTSALPPPEALRLAAEKRLADAVAALEEERRAVVARALDDERRRQERFAAEADAAARRHAVQARGQLERARARLAEAERSEAASPEAARHARSLVSLLEGQLRHEEALLGEDEKRRRRETDAALAALAKHLETRVVTRLAALARFWVV